MVVITIREATKLRFESILTEFKSKYTDSKINQDFILRKLLDKFEGDLQ